MKLKLLLLLLFAVPAWAQTVISINGGQLVISCNAVTAATSNNPGTVGGCASLATPSPNGQLAGGFTWQTIYTGGPASVSVTFVGSIDGSTWTTLDTSTSTGGEIRSITGKPMRFVGCVPGTLSGGTNPSVTCQVALTTASAGGGGGGGGGSGTVTSVSGTANQIVVTNGTTTPVISLANPLVTPGPETITGGTITTDVQPLKVTATYSNAAQVFNGSEFVTVDTAHNTGSMLLQFLCGVAGTTVCFSLDTSGNSINLGTSSATAQKANGTGAGLQEVTQGASNIGLLDANSAAFMAPTSIPTAYAILMPTAAPTAASVFTIGAVSAQVSQGGFTPTPAVGTDGSVAGYWQAANGSSNAHTRWGSSATTSNEVDGPTVVPVDGDLLRCTVAGASTTCVLTDAGFLASNVVTAAGTLTSTALMTGGGSKAAQTPCATCTLSSGGALVLVAGGTVGSLDTGTPTFTFATNKVTLSQPLTISQTTNEIVFGTSTNLTTLNFPAPSGAVTLTFPNTATSMVSAAATLTSNHIMVGAGVATSAAAANTTDDGTTFTTTDTSGVKSPVFTATGTTAGFFDFPQGTTSSAVAPCNVATSICIQAPTSVTSYLITMPGAAPAQNGSLKSTTTAGVETYVHALPANTDPNAGIYNFNQANQSQVVVSGTEYYITRSDLDMPATYSTAIGAGTTMRWHIQMQKTAAGTGSFQVLLKKGTNGSTADTSIVTQTIGATQTGVVDNLTLDITLTWTSATAAYWSISPRQLAASAAGFGLVYPAVALDFNGTISGQTTTTASDKYGISVISTTGTPTLTFTQVQAQAYGVN